MVYWHLMMFHTVDGCNE